MWREGERDGEGEIGSYLENGEKRKYYYANDANQQGQSMCASVCVCVCVCVYVCEFQWDY